MKPQAKEKKKAERPVLSRNTRPGPTRPGQINLLYNQVFIAFVLVAITAISYLPSVNNDFIPTWDDMDFVTNNPIIKSLSPANIRLMFTTQVAGMYVPLPMLTYAIEYSIWGLNPVPFHVTNLLLHLISTFLVFRILCMLKLKVPYAAAAALIYGIHPMGTESVAWVTERKDLLYSVFYFESILMYIRYVTGKNRKTLWYLSGLGFFILALFSKIQAVSLPLVLLAVDYYFQRKSWLKQLLEKIPFFVLSLVFGVAGIFILQHAGALKVNEIFKFSERIFFGTYALSAYILKFFAPVMLSALHPYPGPSGMTLPVLYYLSPVFVILVALGVYFTRKKTRAVVFGSLVFFLSILFLLQVFGAGQGFLADRFTKVPYLGLVFLAGWGMEQACSRWGRWKMMIWLLFAGYALVFSVYTFNRCHVWKNGESLWTDVITKYPDKDPRPYYLRGLYYRDEKDNDKALLDFNIALRRANPDPQFLLIRGNIFFDQGNFDSAYIDYIRALKIQMNDAVAFGNLGAIYIKRSKFDSAVFYLDRSIRLDSTYANTFANRAVANDRLGKTEESIADFKHYLAFQPDDETVIMSIALAYKKIGRYDESLEWMNKALALKPDFGYYYFYRSQIFKLLGERAKALADAQKAQELGIQVPPKYIMSLR